MMAEENKKTVGQRYEELRSTVSQYESRAEEMSRLTKPMIFPKDGFSSSTKHQDSLSSSMGAIAVDSLTNKIVNSLLPSSSIPFKFDPDNEALEMISLGDASIRSEINTELTNQSIKVNKEMEAQDMRTPTYDIIQYAMVVGALVIEKLPEKGIKYHGLRTIGVELDDEGEAVDIILEEKIHPKKLPEGIELTAELEDSEDKLTLLTRYMYDNGTWTMTQELEGEPYGDEKTYNNENVPVQYIGWSFNKGDTYHRSFCESRKGDLNSYDLLAKVVNQGALLSSKALIMVNPLGTTKKVAVAKSENGDVIDGRQDDITSFQLQKNYDYQVSLQRLAELKESLSESFLMNVSATRQAERVTAQEVAYMAREVETVLSGMYSKFSNKITKRYITWIMNELSIKFEAVDVNIITGLNALGADVEAQKLDAYVGRIAQYEATNLLKMREVIDRYANYIGINTVGLIKSEQEIQQEQQAAMQQQQQQMMAEEGAAAVGRTGGENVANALTGQQAQPQRQQKQ